jgi:nucleoside-diphosphate-sugar epimerase
MKLLHIGSTGYIGSAVTRALTQAGHDVVGLLRPSERGSLSTTGSASETSPTSHRCATP